MSTSSSNSWTQAWWRAARRWLGAGDDPGGCRESEEISGVAPGVRFAVGAGGGESLPVLLRRAMRGGVPDPYRRAEIYQKDRERQYARIGGDDSRREHPGTELLSGMSSGRAVRRLVRAADVQQKADRDWEAATLLDGLVLRGAADAPAEP